MKSEKVPSGTDFSSPNGRKSSRFTSAPFLSVTSRVDPKWSAVRYCTSAPAAGPNSIANCPAAS